MSEKTNLGIVGLGAMGFEMLGVAAEHSDFDVLLCADIDPESVSCARDKYPRIQFTTSPADVIESQEIEAVYIATPPIFHADYAIRAMRQGKAVFCEKPLAISSSDGETMVEVATQTGVANALNFALADRHAALEIERALKSGEIGDVRGVDVRLLFPRWLRDFQVGATWLAGRSTHSHPSSRSAAKNNRGVRRSRQFIFTWVMTFIFSQPNVLTAQEKVPAKHPYDSERALTEPTIFGEGIISTGDFESHPEFTPDGKTLYFLKDSPAFNFWTICVSHFRDGKWSQPEVAPFSGQYSDADPFITADGSKLFFISNRPLKPGDKPKEDMDIWMMTKEGSGWSSPVNLGAPVNTNGSEWYPTVAADGTLYFGSDRDGGHGRTDLYRSRFVDGKYSEAENLGSTINTAADEFEPYIAPDQSFLIFMSQRPEDHGRGKLYLSYQRDGKWTAPVNLGDKINSSRAEYSPKISPNGKYFFWSSTRTTVRPAQERRLSYDELTKLVRSAGNGLGDIYQIDISALKL